MPERLEIALCPGRERALPEALDAIVANDIKRYTRLVREHNIKAE